MTSKSATSRTEPVIKSQRGLDRTSANDNDGRIGAPLYTDVWPNTKVARVAALVARGYSGTAIAAELNDGTTPNQISAMVCKWGITPKSSDPRFTYVDVPVPLAAKFRTQLAAEASRRGMAMEELMAGMAETICRDSLFGAVLDG